MSVTPKKIPTNKRNYQLSVKCLKMITGDIINIMRDLIKQFYMSLTTKQ